MSFDHAKLVKQLVLHEGKRNKPYRDTVGKLTIGIGRNLDDRGLTDDECYELLNNDIRSCAMDLDGALPWWRDMDEVRQRVLLDLCFNLGLTKLLKFKNTLAAMEAGDYAGAAKGLRASKWASQVKTRADRLIAMMTSGED